MPKRQDIESILIIGSGPIIIGQACEFDYSGSQACKALKEEGYKIILVNSNPATIMTDPELADRTYIEPITPEVVEKIIAKERPDAVLPTLGGQTGLNTAMDLHRLGILEKYNVEMIGAKAEVIHKAEDRDEFRKAMADIGVDTPRSYLAHNMEDCWEAISNLDFPAIVRPAYTLGGMGGGIAYNREEFEEICRNGLDLSPVTEILIEESVIGWKEFELEVMRDYKDNVVIVCSIENIDPMGVHTGDSITLAPAQTLTDKEYQVLRDASLAIIREIGVETGGSNIQFATNPKDGRLVVIEMNPRVSRSSALASKATGFPIAKFAAKLAVGYTLDEISNDITRETPASFEPTIDYVVLKTPRFAFEKFPDTDDTLTTQMKSVGEAMAIGRTFKESLQKALRSLEISRYGFGGDAKDPHLAGTPLSRDALAEKIARPTADRLFYVQEALRAGMEATEVARITMIDPWFVWHLFEIVEHQRHLESLSLDQLDENEFRQAKEMGFSDIQLATIFKVSETDIRNKREAAGVLPVYKRVDTCAAEFEAYTPYYYSTYEEENELEEVTDKKKIMILGGGPNRIGQGIEFDYCCCHAAMALSEAGYETIMVNSNPETVSTDYDTSDELFFEPLTVEDVQAIAKQVKADGIVVQLGGQTPLKISNELESLGLPIIGTSPDAIDRAEDRERFKELAEKLDLKQPENDIAFTVEEAAEKAKGIGYPLVVRPSYVLGGRAMEIVYNEEQLLKYMKKAVQLNPEHPILLDRFLEDAVELDVDAISDGNLVVIGAIMEHIEEAGIHSGDSTAVMPPFTLSESMLDRIRAQTVALGKELGVVGLMNVQFAIKDDDLYIIEVNPRASRTVPFISKAIGHPLAKYAARVMAGETLKDIGFTEEVKIDHFAVKEPVFSFSRFPGTDILLGPEMKSTGEVMGLDKDYGCALAKAKMGAQLPLPKDGKVFISVKDSDKRGIINSARLLATNGYTLVATSGTAAVLRRNGVDCATVSKIGEGRPDVLDIMKNDEIVLVVNTPQEEHARKDEVKIRNLTVQKRIPCITTLPAIDAAVHGMLAIKEHGVNVQALQDYF